MLKRVEWKQVRNFMIYGGLVHAPIVFSWMNLASKFFPGTHWKAILMKVTIDITVFAPIALSSFYVGLSTLEGKDLKGIYLEWRTKFPGTWAYGALIWPILQTINFRFVPFKNRSIFVGVMSFFWTTILSFWKSQIR